MNEVTSQIQRMKTNKASGPDGVPAAVFKAMPAQWIIYLTTLFNIIFSSAEYPVSWSTAKLTMIFKKGNRLLPENYRGISVVNAVAKLYDLVLCARLERWYRPHREQAGAQRGRSCAENILALRFLTDYAKRKKKLLYVMYVDFSSAYDMIPRQLLLNTLKELGCGAVFLAAIAATYHTTQSLLGTVLITTICGVRQGMPTSCPLFLIYVHSMIKMIKDANGPDGFLDWLHVIMLMDDTILMATSRKRMKEKIRTLKSFCRQYGMVINQKKTNFMAINGRAEDLADIIVDDLTVQHTDLYIYLGAAFTSDGGISSAVRAQMISKAKDFNKFISFLNKNNDLPFILKRKVFETAFIPAILYGCESWLNGDLKPVKKMYNEAMKHLLGVRYNTCTDLCLVEAGFPPVEAVIKHRQKSLLKRIWAERRHMHDDPFAHAMRIVLASRYVTSTYVTQLLEEDEDVVALAVQRLQEGIQGSTSSRRVTYRDTINPDLRASPIYSADHLIPEERRKAFSRFRVSSHSLAIETGRWNRRGRGRLPVEERLCPCGQVQTEEHVVTHCPRTQQLRDEYGIHSMRDLNSRQATLQSTCDFIFKILESYNE